jgi:hypothetical protein
MEPNTLIVLGVLFLSLITVESGGVFLTYVVRGKAPANALQMSFYRAGHAHAAVLLVLSMLILSVIDQFEIPLALDLVARFGVPIAAILMPAGFFLSVLGKDPVKPGKAYILLWIGATSLTLGLLACGIAALGTGIGALQ